MQQQQANDNSAGSTAQAAATPTEAQDHTSTIDTVDGSASTFDAVDLSGALGGSGSGSFDSFATAVKQAEQEVAAVGSLDGLLSDGVKDNIALWGSKGSEAGPEAGQRHVNGATRR